MAMNKTFWVAAGAGASLIAALGLRYAWNENAGEVVAPLAKDTPVQTFKAALEKEQNAFSIVETPPKPAPQKKATISDAKAAEIADAIIAEYAESDQDNTVTETLYGEEFNCQKSRFSKPRNTKNGVKGPLFDECESASESSARFDHAIMNGQIIRIPVSVNLNSGEYKHIVNFVNKLIEDEFGTQTILTRPVFKQYFNAASQAKQTERYSYETNQLEEMELSFSDGSPDGVDVSIEFHKDESINYINFVGGAHHRFGLEYSTIYCESNGLASRIIVDPDPQYKIIDEIQCPTLEGLGINRIPDIPAL